MHCGLSIFYKLNRPKCRIYSITALGVGSISESTPMTHREIRPLRIKTSNAPEEPETSSTNPELQKIVVPTTANTVIICGNSADTNKGLHSVELLSRKVKDSV